MFRSGRIIPWFEGASALVLLIMLPVSWLVMHDYYERGGLLPAWLTATLLLANLIPAMALMALMARRIAVGRSSLRNGRGRLHVRFVGLFSLITCIPMIMVVIFAALMFQYGVEFWFSERSRSMLENANELAEGYYVDSRRDVNAEAVAMASDLRSYLQQTEIDSPEFAEAYVYQVLTRKLNESAIIEIGEDGEPRTAAIIDPDNRASADRVTPEVLHRLKSGEEAVISSLPDRIEVVTVLDEKAEIYLYAARASSQLALGQWEKAQEVLTDYDALFARSRSLQIRFNIILYLISLLLVALALWGALRFADRMVRPLTDLADAARQISRGNFATRVDGIKRRDEVGLLGRAFNRMALKLDNMTHDLIDANEKLDNRRAFMETVLESLTAGVVSIDEDGVVRLMNSSAQKLLDCGPQMCLGETLVDIAPQFAPLVDGSSQRSVIQYSRKGKLLTLATKASAHPFGMVITFEDITRQLLDQRQAAWSDVAQRIAHEIKNPLTPIQLAAERIKRRYGKLIDESDDVFVNLTDTIIRQVGDLRNMVDEFSSFARMPKPVFREENLYELVRQSIFLHEVANSNVTFTLEGNEDEGLVYCDRRQIAQALTNILKNALEAIEARQSMQRERNSAQSDGSADDPAIAALSGASDGAQDGQILVRLNEQDEQLVLTIDDNGVGLPADKEHMAEPYMTTREKGTGLGLAIVKKIVEEHYGELGFVTGDLQGVQVRISLKPALLRDLASRGALNDGSFEQTSAQESLLAAAENMKG